MTNESLFTNDESFALYSLYKAQADCIRAVIVKVETDNIISVSTRDKEFKLILDNTWRYIAHHALPGTILHLIHVQKREDQEGCWFECTQDTCIVVQPDILISATTIADCAKSDYFDTDVAIIKRFSLDDMSIHILRGIVINALFDAIIEKQNAALTISEGTTQDTASPIAFETLVLQALSGSALAVSMIFRDNDGKFHSTMFQEFISECKSIFHALQEFCATLDVTNALIEPTFISPLYGLQGRLDILLESTDDPNQKNIIELKASAPFSGRVSPAYRVQIMCYQLLISTCFPQRTGTTSILYARAKNAVGEFSPLLLSSPFSLELRNHVITTRNILVLQEWYFSKGKYSYLTRLMRKENASTLFEQERASLHHLQKLLQSLASAPDSLDKEYFKALLQSIAREQIAAKIGNEKSVIDDVQSTKFGFSALWRNNIAMKQLHGICIAYLRYNADLSDTKQQHLHFDFTTDTTSFTTLREGDRIILSSTNITSPTTEPIIKGTIIELYPTSVRISLQNKHHSHAQWSKRLLEETWSIEPDLLSGESDVHYKALYQFFSASQTQRDLWLGRKEPTTTPQRIPPHYSDLSTAQYDLLCKAIQADNYFLLQGPPGTGKTSRMVKNLIRYYLENTNECIILLACTNRAVSEMCEAFLSLSIATHVPSLRCTSKYGGAEQHEEIPTLYSITKTITSLDEIKSIPEYLRSVRIVFATVASFHRHRHLLQLRRFTRLIVDEASQLTEIDLLGFVTHFESTILIGDQCQLPAVLLQNEEEASYSSDILHDAGIHSTQISLFERLIANAQQRGWDHTYGMLQQQARMHQTIQNAINPLFYDNKLEIFRESQSQSTLRKEFSLEELPDQRFIMIDTPNEDGFKYNSVEARLCATLTIAFAHRLHEELHPLSIGIIAPFRAQNNAIRALLPENLRNLITVDTVERFQGSERDIIIISCAINDVSHIRSIQSLSYHVSPVSNQSVPIIDRKLNVAISRARERCIIIGNMQSLTHDTVIGQHYTSLKRYAESSQSYFSYEILSKSLLLKNSLE